ncbi:MAG TPA: hypothetical protein VJS92_15430, partial [Candidatus Polarisedimenticolaceae bacterium]|nr:hypothetical protein [Candidatus Polarisedimenticolaceae bacterium]
MPTARNRGFCAGLALLGLLGGTAVPAATPAGTEIRNVAQGSYVPGANTSTTPLQSNPVSTWVVDSNCFGPLELAVEPAGTVAPGTPLHYTLTVMNAAGAPLAAVRVELALDPGVDDPTSFTTGTAEKVGGGAVPVVASYDPGTRVITWLIDPLAAAAGVMLHASVAARTDLPAETRIVERGAASSTYCSPMSTADVTIGVVPPILELTKRADRSVAIPGDALLFELVVRNADAAMGLDDLELVDTLPPALRYVRGSTRVDGIAASDPQVSGDGRELRLALGNLAAGAVRTVTLGAVVAPGARQGEALNRAQAAATTPGGLALPSNPASAAVTIVPGPFGREAHLVGRVFVDLDADGRPGAGEPGVPGALVLLEDGRGAVADITGLWHVEAVRPGTHVLRLDPASLPPGIEPRAAGIDWAGTRWTRFVEARPTTLVIADLPVGPADAPRCEIHAAQLALRVPRAVLLGPAGQVHLEAAARWLAERGVSDARSV